MNVHPAIQALRGDWASQRRAQGLVQSAILDWHGSDRTRAVSCDLHAYDEGASLADCRELAGLFADRCSALRWVEALLSRIISSLRDNRLADLPLRTSCSDGFATIQLLTKGRAALNLTVHEPRPVSKPPKTVLLVDRESTELLLEGSAGIALHRSEEHAGEPIRFQSIQRMWRPGGTIELGPNDARHITQFERSLLTLQLTRAAANPQATRKYCLTDGRLLQSASGDKQASCDVMAMGVLGAMPVRGAVATMRAIASDRSYDPDLRWEATRQALSVDTSAGFGMLVELAGTSDDPLSRPASRLKSQLIAAHPQIAEWYKEAA